MATEAVTQNFVNGGSLGTDFFLFFRRHERMTKLEGWVGPRNGNPGATEVIRGLRVTYVGQAPVSKGKLEGVRKEIDIGASHDVAEATIYAGDSVDTILLKINGQNYQIGGQQGRRFPQHVGTGVPLGLVGRAGENIEALGIAFEQSVFDPH
jgi:hypothetical protein